MPKLPSLQQLFRGFVAVIRRFPLEILASIIGTVATMILTEKEGEYTSEQVQVLVRIILCSILALSLLLSVSVYVEEQKISWRKSLTIRIPALALIVLFFFFPPSHRQHDQYFSVRIFVRSLSLACVVRSLHSERKHLSVLGIQQAALFANSNGRVV